MSTKMIDRYVNYFRYAAVLSDDLCSFCAKYDGKGIVAHNCTYYWQNDKGERILPTDFNSRTADWQGSGYLPYKPLNVVLSDGPAALPEVTLVFKVKRDHVSLECKEVPGFDFVICGDMRWGEDPEHSTFAVSLERPGYGMRSALGPAVSKWDDALLDRADGSVVRLDAAGGVKLDWSWEKGCYTFEAKGTVGMQVYPHYYEDRFQINYRPVCKTNGYAAPPAGWMTWYAVKFDACEEAVLENTRLQKELLGDYGADTVWVDWEWYHNGFNDDMTPEVSYFNPDPNRYPHGLKYLAEKIEEYGFVPALWIAPTHEPIETDYIRENPETVLVDKVIWCGRFFFDITSPKFLEDYLPRAIRQVPAWGYKALKWDCLPFTLIYADRMHGNMYDSESSSYQSFRKVMQMARDILGENYYMLSCSGANDSHLLSACDVFDAARIGGDIFEWDEFIKQMIARAVRLYPYHNTVVYCDPDNVVLREEFNDMNQARSRVSFVSLLGMPVTFGDDLRELPMERVELLRRGLPTLDIHPMEIRELELEHDSLIINLMINRPFERWNVVGVMNLAEEERTLTIDLDQELGLEEGEYLVHEYWSDTFYGVVSGTVEITIPACGTAVLAIRKKTGKPQLVSTSRHITQGGADLVSVSFENGVLSGVSKVVRDDPYTIKVYDPNRDVLLEKTILPETTRELEWTFEF